MKKIFGISLSALIWATSVFALDSIDYDEINHIIDHFSFVWNNQEGHGIADHYVQDADFVGHIGILVSGKDEIERKHQILQTLLKGSTFEVTDRNLREIQSGVVIAHVFWSVSNIQGPGIYENKHMKGIFTHVFQKNGEKWEIIASHNTITR